MSSGGLITTPDICVIVPAFKQPGLMIEAVEDVLAQSISERVHILLGPDGCPYPSTHEMCATYASAYPDKITVIDNGVNGGLSGNRNACVDAALAMFPKLSALTFLDADDRLHPRAVENFDVQLRSTKTRSREDGRRVGWVYTDPFQFGGVHNFLRKPRPYSILWHLFANSNSATSLVDADVFRAGCRFDESMRKGYEDWDFWLQAIRSGFVGEFVSPPTFYYRRRPESMSSSADMHERAIEQYVRSKNRDLFKAELLFEAEQHENPLFAYTEDGESFRVFSDPQEGSRNVSREALRAIIDRARLLPIMAAPSVIVWGGVGAWEELKRYGILRSALWRLYGDLAGSDIALLSNSSRIWRHESIGISEAHVVDAVILVAARSSYVLANPNPRHWWGAAQILTLDLVDAEVVPNPVESIASLAEEPATNGDAFAYLDYWQPKGIAFRDIAGHLLGAARPLVNLDSASTVGFWMGGPSGPIPGALSSLVVDLEGMAPRPHLVRYRLEGRAPVQIHADGVEDVVLPAHFLGPRLEEGYHSKHYLGSLISEWMFSADKTTVVGATAACKAIVNLGDPRLSAAAYAIGQAGVGVYAFVAAAADAAWLDNLLAYEHAYRAVFLEDEAAKTYLIARGFPAEKVIMSPPNLAQQP